MFLIVYFLVILAGCYHTIQWGVNCPGSQENKRVYTIHAPLRKTGKPGGGQNNESNKTLVEKIKQRQKRACQSKPWNGLCQLRSAYSMPSCQRICTLPGAARVLVLPAKMDQALASELDGIKELRRAMNHSRS